MYAMSMILLLIPLCVIFPARGETNKRSRESNTLHLIPRKSSKLGQSIFNKIIESADDPALRFQQPMISFTIYLLVSRTAASDLLEATFQIEKIWKSRGQTLNMWPNAIQKRSLCLRQLKNYLARTKV